MKPVFVYSAIVTHCHDGDSGYIELDLGCYVKTTVPFRMKGINTPELKRETKEAGIAARDYFRSLVMGKSVVAKTYKNEKFGRFLVELSVDGVDINAEMVEKGFAVPFMVD